MRSGRTSPDPTASPLAIQALTVVLLACAWETIGRTGLLFPELFPPLFEIVHSLGIYLTTGVMLPHLRASLYEVLGGLVVGLATGIPLGIVLGSRSSFIEVTEPIILYLAVIPKIVIFPIFILFLGIGTESKLAVGAIASFFPIVLLTMAGMREVRPVYVDVARTLGARRLQIAKKVYLPAIAAPVFTGLRIGLGAAVTGALLAETKIAKAGLGFMIVEYYSQFRLADMYALLLLIFILAALANWLMKALFAMLLPLPRTSQDPGLFF
ncbi:MAG TPA: ABC transporter permease [Candidatus Eisenbacteria bacterium]|nr:ABC transporter permease [Candidatus Eisenbacteria bacterium]